MNEIMEFISGFNIQTILSLMAIMWYCMRHMDGKIAELSLEIKEVDGKIDRISEMQAARTDKLYEMFIDLLKEGRVK